MAVMTGKTVVALCMAGFLGVAAPVCAGPLTIVNDTPWDIMNILATSSAGGQRFYWRLDMPPRGNDVVDNPEARLSLRVDTGLALCSFPDVPLAHGRRIIFTTKPQVTIEYDAGNTDSVPGACEPLLPQPGSQPVCNLDKFRPDMPMKDVCAILPEQMPRDDNGSLLTGLGFANMNWAARLVPAANAPVSENSLLDHLELRRPLEPETLSTLVNALFQKGYVPWQAEFPGIDMEFRTRDASERDVDVLLSAMNGFINAHSIRGHAEHALKEKCDEAHIIMAPAAMLPDLETADEPPADVQIYTIVLRPCTHMLLLDLAAYHGPRG